MAILDNLFKSSKQLKQEKDLETKRAGRQANRAVKKSANNIAKLQRECEALEREAKELIRSGNKANQSRINYCAKLYQSKKNTIEQLQKSQLTNEHAISSIGVAATITETTQAIAEYSRVAAPDLIKLDENQQQIANVTDSLADVADIVAEGYDNTVDSINENSVDTEYGVDLQVDAWTAEVQTGIFGSASTVPGETAAATEQEDSLAARIAKLDAGNK